MTTVLIIGSGINAVGSSVWPRARFDCIVAINNAWAVRPDWDVHIHPKDFPLNRRPPALINRQTIVTAKDYVPLQNRWGGFVYAGGTMAFTAAYWAMASQKPAVIAMIGCDMVYPKTGKTHFYGNGAPDPLREDISLRSLEAKSARLAALAAGNGCAMVNLSTDPSRLTFPRSTADQAARCQPMTYSAAAIAAALAEEDRLGYYVPSGKYWKEEDRFDPAAIDALDRMWVTAGRPL